MSDNPDVNSSDALHHDLHVQQQGQSREYNLEHDDGGHQAAQESQHTNWATGARDNVQLPPDDLIQLWTKASSHLPSITPEERLKILERWPLDEYNQQCLSRSGQTFDQLLEKATSHPDSLQGLEANIILYSPKFGLYERGQEPSSQRLAWPKGLSAKRWEAQQAVEDDRDRNARRNAERAQNRTNRELREARERLSIDDRQNITWCNKANWVQKLDESFDQCWGFALYRTSFDNNEAWKIFQQRFEEATKTALLIAQDADFIRQRWKIQYIEDRQLDNATLTQLAEDFRHRENDIWPHLRRDAFLFADEAAIHSAVEHHPLPERGYVNAVDATFTAESLDKYQHGFTGSLKVSLTNVMTTFFARLDSNGKSEETKRMMQSWDVMYFKAMYNQPGNVYPPQSMMNRGLDDSQHEE